MNSILRKTAVQSAAVRQLETGNRVNISGIAATTGIPRGEVSSILNSAGNPKTTDTECRQNITSRILSAWHHDPRFISANGRPRNLKIFGAGPTFESLVKEYGQGIPIRAMFDELRRLEAIEVRAFSQRVFPKMSLAINRRITRQRIHDVDTTISGLIAYLQGFSDIAFVEKVSGAKMWSGAVPAIRNKSRTNAGVLLRELHKKMALKLARHGLVDTRKTAHLSVTIIYSETRNRVAKRPFKSRRNFRRGD